MSQYGKYSSVGMAQDPSSVPASSTSSSTPVTSASTAFVTAMTTNITLTADSAPIQAIATATLTTTGAASVARVRTTINGVASEVQDISLTALSTNYAVSVTQMSANLAPGTYAVVFQISRLSGTGTVNFARGTLIAEGLQGGVSAGITRLTGALQAGPGSGSQVLTGTLPVTNGGTGLSSTTANRILYSSANNVIGQITSAATSALVTNSASVPSFASGTTANRLLRTNGTTISFAQAALTTDVTGILPGANGGTGSTMFASTRVPFSNGTSYAADALFLYQTSNTRFIVGQGGGTGRINGTVSLTDPSPNDLAGNFFSRTTGNNCVNIQNENALITLNMTNSGAPSQGVSVMAAASNGTLPARTQSIAGDMLLTIQAQGRTASAWSTGTAVKIAVNTTENVTDTTNGGEIAISTTPNGGATPVEHLRIKQSGETVLVDSHLRSNQTTAPTALANANAGTGASVSLITATDTAGVIELTTGIGPYAAGAMVDVTFNKAYSVAPVVVFCPANAAAAQSTSPHDIYVDAISTTGFSIMFGQQENSSGVVYKWNYMVIETQ